MVEAIKIMVSEGELIKRIKNELVDYGVCDKEEIDNFEERPIVVSLILSHIYEMIREYPQFDNGASEKESWQKLVDVYIRLMVARDKWFKKWFGDDINGV